MALSCRAGCRSVVQRGGGPGRAPCRKICLFCMVLLAVLCKYILYIYIYIYPFAPMNASLLTDPSKLPSNFIAPAHPANLRPRIAKLFVFQAIHRSISHSLGCLTDSSKDHLERLGSHSHHSMSPWSCGNDGLFSRRVGEEGPIWSVFFHEC